MGEPTADIALIGLAVMGQNLILNMNDHGFVVCAYNRTTQKVTSFLEKEAKGTNVIGAYSIEEMVSKLKLPRRVMLLVKAGEAVDNFIKQLLPHLSPGDIIIDGGNSEYEDTMRRTKQLKAKDILFVGSGVSGGEDGARYGPSLMPGGNPKAWPYIKDIFQAIAAKVDGVPCCDWVGDSGSGHFVKMVHNGIEYGDMQLICEAYHIMRTGLKMSPQEMSDIFDQWNQGDLNSFLIEITRDILKYKDDNGYLLERIRDSAGQKGTGKWTTLASLSYQVPVTLIADSVFSRIISSFKSERVELSKKYQHTEIKPSRLYDKKTILNAMQKALYLSKIISYAQGFMLLREAAKQHKWKLNYGAIALMWRGGCIIRSAFLGNIKEAFDKNPELENLLLDKFFETAVKDCVLSARHIVSVALNMEITAPAMYAALNFYDTFRISDLLQSRVTTNCIEQAIDDKISHPSVNWVYEACIGGTIEYLHNSILFGQMQIIRELFDIMQQVLKLSTVDISNIFNKWSEDESSVVFGICRDALRKQDLNKDDVYEMEKKYAKLIANKALEVGSPLTMVTQSVFTRYLHSVDIKSDIQPSAVFPESRTDREVKLNRTEAMLFMSEAFRFSSIILYTQAFILIRESFKIHDWITNYRQIIDFWKEIGILNGDLFDKIKEAFDNDSDLQNLLLADSIATIMKECNKSMRFVISSSIGRGISTPALSSAVAFYDGFTTECLPANLLQAMRDCFGAHTYELLGQEGKFIHTNWTGHGGEVSASTYDA